MTYLPISTFEIYIYQYLRSKYPLSKYLRVSGLASWRGTGAWRSARTWRAAAAPRTRSARRTAASGRRWVLRNYSCRHLLRAALRREQKINNDSFRAGFKMCAVLTAAVGKLFLLANWFLAPRVLNSSQVYTLISRPLNRATNVCSTNTRLARSNCIKTIFFHKNHNYLTVHNL